MPYVLGVSGAAAYGAEHGRAEGYAVYFGIPVGEVDVRFASLVFALVAAFAVPMVAVVYLCFVSTQGEDGLPRSLLVVFVLIGFSPWPFSGMADRAAALALVLVVSLYLAVLAIRHPERAAAIAAWFRGRWQPVRAHVVPRDTAVLRAWAPVLTAVLAGSAVVLGAWHGGEWLGRNVAANQTVFEVRSHDPAGPTATVVFRFDDTLVERVLDLAAEPGKPPRNVWLPETTVRPLPAGGVTYTPTVLGRTFPGGADPDLFR